MQLILPRTPAPTSKRCRDNFTSLSPGLGHVWDGPKPTLTELMIMAAGSSGQPLEGHLPAGRSDSHGEDRPVYQHEFRRAARCVAPAATVAKSTASREG